MTAHHDDPRITLIRRSLVAPTEGTVWVKIEGIARIIMYEAPDDSMRGALIVAGDQLLYDGARTAPKDGDIVMVRHGDDFLPRVFRDLGSHVEARPTEPGYETIRAASRAELRVYGTYAGLVRAVGNEEVAR